MNLSEDELSIIQNLAKAGGTGNVMAILNFNSEYFDHGFSIAVEMQNKDLIKLLYSNYNKNLIAIELTLVGYQKIKSN